MTINSNNNHNGNGKSKIPANNHQEPDPQLNLSIPPEIEQSQVLFLVLERLNQMEERQKQLNQTQHDLIKALATQGTNQGQLSTTITQSLKNLELSKQPQPEKLENLQQNLSDLRQKEIIPLKQSLNSIAQGINNLPTKISNNIRQAINPQNQTSNFNLTQRELIGLVLSYSFLSLVLNVSSFKIVQSSDYYQTMTYLQSIYERLDWTNTKLERIEKKLGTAPKK